MGNSAAIDRGALASCDVHVARDQDGTEDKGDPKDQPCYAWSNARVARLMEVTHKITMIYASRMLLNQL